jgi:hypothetical protein
MKPSLNIYPLPNIFMHVARADVQRLRALIGERLEEEDPGHLA